MPRFRVTLRARVWTYSALEVVADTGQQAVRRAMRLRRMDEPKLKEGEDIGEFCDSSDPLDSALALHSLTRLDEEPR